MSSLAYKARIERTADNFRDAIFISNAHDI